jgi:hypothetical protein
MQIKGRWDKVMTSVLIILTPVSVDGHDAFTRSASADEQDSKDSYDDSDNTTDGAADYGGQVTVR